MTRLFQGLTVCSPKPGRIDLFTGGEGGGVWHKTFDGLAGTWSTWKSLGEEHILALAATSSGLDRIDLLAILEGPTRKYLAHKRYAGGWSEWELRPLETSIRYRPTLAVAASGPDRLDVYLLAEGVYRVRHVPLGGDEPASWLPMELSISPTAVAAVSPAPGRVELFLEVGSRIEHWRFQTGWSPGQNPGVPPGLAPRSPRRFAASARLDLFAEVADGGLWHKRLEGSQTWEALGGDLVDPFALAPFDLAPQAEGLASVSWGTGRVDVFAIWAGVALMHRWFNSGAWSDWAVVDVWPRPRRAYRVLRPQDLVVLDVRGVGLREQVGSDGAVELTAEQDGARLVVSFPAQHITEEVFSDWTSEGLRHARSGGVLEEHWFYKTPDQINGPYHNPSRLVFAVARGDRAVPLSVPGVLDAMARLPLVVKPLGSAGHPTPDENETAIELPWRIIMSPQVGVKCAHRQLPGTGAGGATELWHTRLLGREGSGRLALHPTQARSSHPFPSFDVPLPEQTRVAIVNAARASGLGIAVERLMLSAYGGWLSARGTWPAANLQWTHHAAMGRDYHVRVAKRGALFPFGHRVVWVTAFDRVFARAEYSGAELRSKNSLIVTEPVREYAWHEREFPFQRVTVEPQILESFNPQTVNICGYTAFWPFRNGRPVEFSLRARAGEEEVELTLPLLFVPEEALKPWCVVDIAREYSKGPNEPFREVQKPKALVGRQIPIAMKSATEPLDRQEVHSLTFSGAQRSASDVGFFPKVTELEVSLPAVRQLLDPRPPQTAEFSTELKNALPGGAPNVLLDLTSPEERRSLNFASTAERIGALAAPNFQMKQVHRIFGPIADPVLPPSQLFDLSAKLLGIISLRDVLPPITTTPNLTWSEGSPDSPPAATFVWNENLEEQADGTFLPGAASNIDLKVVSKIVDGQPELHTTGVLKDFKVRVPPGEPLVQLAFKELCFTSGTAQRPNITFDFDPQQVKLLGKLRFVEKLQDLMKIAGSGGPHMEVSPTEIQATYRTALPTLAMGALTVQNLVLDTGLRLSLKNEPLVADFAFGTRERPFLVTVSMFGGGGYLELGIDAKGLERFVGGIEFGASVAMDFVIARGEVHVLGGIVFAQMGSAIQITGYLRIGGSVEVLGLIRISVELTVSLTYNAQENALIGAARLVIAIDLTFWSTSVELTCHQRIDGSSSLAIDERFFAIEEAARRTSSVETALGPVGESRPWETYCRAFAVE